MASLDNSALTELLTNGPHRSEVGRKQVTLALGGIYIASTTDAAKPKLVWENERPYAVYYIPVGALHAAIRSRLDKAADGAGDVKVPIEVKTVDTLHGRGNGSKAVIEKLSVGTKSTTHVRFVSGPFKDFIRFEKNEIDQWFENGALSVAIKNPYKRIDTTAVSRHIIVKIDDEVVAETEVAVLLNETGLSETYYIPATSIQDWSTIEKSDLKTACPYKGEAWYLNITVKGKKYENIIWYYQYPTHESAAVEGFISFWRKPEVAIIVDGAKL